MPRIHYPKDGGTSRVRGAVTGRRCRIPRRVSPFITKAHGTLTRRPGKSVVSGHRLRHLRLSTHLKSPQRRIPLLEGLPRPRAPSGSASGVAFSDEVVWRGPSQGSVSARNPFGQLPLASRDQAIVPRDPLRVSVRPVTPSLDGAGLPRPPGLSTRALRPTGSRRLVSQRPPPRLRARFGVRGNTEVHSILRLKGDWQIQLSEPCGSYSGGRLVLNPSG